MWISCSTGGLKIACFTAVLYTAEKRYASSTWRRSAERLCIESVSPDELAGRPAEKMHLTNNLSRTGCQARQDSRDIITMRLHIGTSGWSYHHWRGRFYPRELPETQWLSFYTRHFGTVEINNSFYRLPRRETFAAWRQQTPEGFVFSVKASRYITHMKKLKDPAQTLPPLLTAAEGLADKLGPLLFQLPPKWQADAGRLRAFLETLPKSVPAAFELRDPSWHTDTVLELLAEFNAAFCIYDLGGFASPRAVTADFAYLRLHGPGEPYCGRYGTAALADWAAWLMRQKVLAAHVYFDNDQAAYAVRDALELKAMLA